MKKKLKKRVSFFISENLDNDMQRFVEPTFDVVLSRRDSLHGQVFKMAYSVFRTDPRYFSAGVRRELILYANQCCGGSIETALKRLLEGKIKGSENVS